jgi:hypothetical protein
MALTSSCLLYQTLSRAKFSQQNLLTLNQRHPNSNQPTNPTKKWHFPPELPSPQLLNSNPVSIFRSGCGHFKPLLSNTTKKLTEEADYLQRFSQTPSGPSTNSTAVHALSGATLRGKPSVDLLHLVRCYDGAPLRDSSGVACAACYPRVLLRCPFVV